MGRSGYVVGSKQVMSPMERSVRRSVDGSVMEEPLSAGTGEGVLRTRWRRLYSKASTSDGGAIGRDCGSVVRTHGVKAGLE